MLEMAGGGVQGKGVGTEMSLLVFDQFLAVENS